MHWTDTYNGLPYRIDGRDRKGVDCWGLVCLVYRERLGILLDEKRGVHAAAGEDLRRIAEAAEAESRRWIQVEVPRVYDVVLLRVGLLPCHAGLCIGRGLMLHCLEGVNSTVESYLGLRWKRRVVGFYRHV